MSSIAEIFADFNNIDRYGRVRLNVNGTHADIRRKNIVLEEGLIILLNDNDGLCVEATIQFSIEENIWVAKLDEDKLRYLS